MPIESIVFLALSVHTLIWSIQLYREKWLFIGAGFNTMSQAQRAKYDINRLSKSLCVSMFVLSLSFFSLLFLPDWGAIVMVCLIVIMLIIIVVIVNSSYVKIKATSSSKNIDDKD